VIQEAWIAGVSTRGVGELMQAMGMSGISKSSVLKLCREHRRTGECVPEAPARGRVAFFWLDATYLKVREVGRLVSVAAIIAVAVTTEGNALLVYCCRDRR
jgi:transposase-like protein